MGTNKKLDEAFFESMFEEGNLDQPSPGFTANVMELVNKEALKKAEENQPIIGYMYIALIGAAFVAAGFVIFGMDLSSVGNIFKGINNEDFKIISNAGNLLQSIKEAFASIQIPSILIIVIIAVISLIGLDRILKKPITTHLFVL